jgi:hypothetical protein
MVHRLLKPVAAIVSVALALEGSRILAVLL